jgi:hypothetical protein
MLDNQHTHAHHCRVAVAYLQSRYSWRLLDSDEWVRRATAAVEQNPLLDPMRAAILVYSCLLYEACSGYYGLVPRNQAYCDLAGYFAAIVRRSGLSDDSIQLALTHIFERLAQCRQPEAFLAFAFSQLHNAERQP